MSSAVAALIVAAALPSTAGATVLTFDDTYAGTGGSLVSYGYGGFDWSNFYALNALYDYSYQAPNGYINGVASGTNVVFNGFANSASISGSQFDFNGAYLTGAWNNGLTIVVSGFANGSLLYSQAVTVDSYQPTWFQFDFMGIDTLTFSSYGGYPAGNTGGGGHFAMDDFTFNAVVHSIGDWVDSSLDLLVGSGGFFGPKLTLNDGDTLAENNLTIADNGSVVQNGGTHVVNGSLQSRGDYKLKGGALAATNQTINASWNYGYGSFEQSGGTNTVNGTLAVGNEYGTTARYDLIDGVLTAFNEVIGSNGGNGVFKQSGGANKVAGTLTVGKNYGYGAYHLDGGELTAQDEVIGDGAEGYGATGFFTQNGGTNTVSGTLTVGKNFGNGTYDLNGGELSAQNEVIGDNGTGTFNQNGGTNTVADTLTVGKNYAWSSSYNLRAGNLIAKNEIIGDSASGTFNQGGYGYGTSNKAETLTLGKQQGGYGTYNLLSGVLTAVGEVIGDAGSGIFNQKGGSNTVAATLTLGKQQGGYGTYNLRDGELTVGDEVIGDAGAGNFTQGDYNNYGYQPSHKVNGTLTLGKQATGQGNYTLYAGTLSTQNTVVGDAGSGYFSQSGGTHNVAQTLTLGKQAGSRGSYSLGAGELTADEEIVGDAGIGDFSQGNSYPFFVAPTSNTVKGTLTLGKQATGQGTYALYSGSLATQDTVVGDAGVGEFYQYFSNHSVAKTLTLGKKASGQGFYYLYSGDLLAQDEIVGDAGNAIFTQGGDSYSSLYGYSASNTVKGALTLGKQAGSQGVYHLVDGALKALNTIVGDAGNGTFNQYGGKHTADNLTLGKQTGSEGLYNQSKGELVTTSTVVGAAGVGTFIQSGGTHTSAVLTLGEQLEGNGAYTLTGGQLTAGQTIVGDAGNGVFTQTGGTHTTQALTLGKQASGYGSYSLLAGTLNTTAATVGDAGTGVVTQTGGTHNAQNLTLGKQAGSEGTYNLRGGNLNVAGNIVNGAGQGALLISGGAVNFGAGAHDVDVDTLKLSNQGAIKLTDGATTTFQKAVVHNGKEINLANGTNAIFNGAFSGKGPFTGGGTATFNSVLNIGDGPVTFNVAGNMELGEHSKSIMQVAGTTRGTGYDAVDVGGSLQLDGELNLLSLNGFSADLGDVFDLYKAETITGEFDLLTLLTLGEGLSWKVEYLIDAVGTTDIVRVSVVSSVPLPASVWLLQSALFGLFAARRLGKKSR